MIKQIQLRGISRTPSDRLSDDGGLSESLNMQVDTAENAPVLLPEDVTSDLGLPNDLQAEKIFIHKTANYENTIVVQKDKVVAYTPQIADKEPISVLTLERGEVVNDITSVGNTLIVSTTKNQYYILFRDRVYSVLGNKVPFPMISFKRDNISKQQKVTNNVSSYNNEGKYWFLQGIGANYIPEESEWNADASTQKEHTGNIRSCLNSFWDIINNLLSEEQKKGKLTSSVFIRYEIDAYGSSLSSLPILVPAPFGGIMTAHISTSKSSILYENDGDNYEIIKRTEEEITLNGEIQSYDIFAQIEDWDYNDWKEIVTGIRIYISKPLDWGVLKYSTQLTNRTTSANIEDENNYSYLSEGDVNFIADTEYLERILENSSLTFLVKEIPLLNPENASLSDEFKELQKGMTLDIHKFLDSSKEDYIQLESQDRLSGDDMKHYLQLSEKLDTFNNQLLLVQPSQIIDYDYSRLNAYDKVNIENTGDSSWYIYDVTYLLKGTTEDKVVKKRFEYYKRRTTEENIYAFQIFPDIRAYKMLVKVEIVQGSNNTYKYGEFDMHPHPFLDCAYYYGGIENKLIDLCTKESIPEYAVNAVDDLDNKLIVSEQDKPFFFPLEHRYTFQSKVLGVAVATTALSQGQFGQFPLYVFTEDGIWVMETASDGSFVSQKPLSREVCVNSDSITPIDNAVVFVTARGVMLVQGSDVVNISPYMNGKHYLPSDAAKELISKQDGFSNFLSVISDEDAFVNYVRDAKVAYDYVGQRLVFISPTNKDFQYVYKIDTQTWHKTSFQDVDILLPLNSYPECLVQGNKNGNTKVYRLDSVLDPSKNQATAKGILITRPFDLGMPDVYKSIKEIKIRGDHENGSVKYFLQGSDNGRDFYTLSSLRGKSWKMFRMFILANLSPTERISWIDIDFEPRYQNRLR